MLIQDKRTEKEMLADIIASKKRTAFVEEYRDKATDQEALGILISQYFEWDGLAILETLYNALEDANFHTINETIEDLIQKLKDGSK